MKKIIIGSLLSMAVLVGLGAGVSKANIATVPNTNNSPVRSVSADPQPTVQVDGVVWAQAVHGRTVYAVGNFTKARPAGVPLGGAGTEDRVNILAYDIVTGKLDPNFKPKIVDENMLPDTVTRAESKRKVAHAVAVSPNGRYLYVGGKFTKVDNVSQSNLAVFDLSNGSLVAGVTQPNRQVKSIATDGQRVFVAGEFNQIGGVNRNQLAAYSMDGKLDSAWGSSFSVAGNITSLTALRGKLVIGGSFSQVNGANRFTTAAVSTATGANLNWAVGGTATQPIKTIFQDPADGKYDYYKSSVTNLSNDGDRVYLTTFTYTTTTQQGMFEGRAALSGDDGRLVWLNDCVGDSYGAYPIGGVLYSASHAHSCAAIGKFGETSPRSYKYGLAETTSPHGAVTGAYGGIYKWNYVDQPASRQLDWYPVFTHAPEFPPNNDTYVSGISQAGWSVVGTIVNGVTYVSYGGEFPKVAGVNQQGLVRFKSTDGEPSTPKYTGSSPYKLIVRPADSSGNSGVYIDNVTDTNNQQLTVDFYRADDNKFLKSQVVTTNTSGYTWASYMGESHPGVSQRYNVIVRDTAANSTSVLGSVIDDTDDYNNVYSGTWQKHSLLNYPNANRTVHYTTQAGATVSRIFYGSEISVIGYKYPSPVKIGVSIDGGAETVVTISSGSSSTLYQQNLYRKTGLGLGLHTIKIRNLQTSATPFVFDGLDTRGDLFYDNLYTDNGVGYTGAWTVRNNYSRTYLNSSAHVTASKSAVASLKFKGSSVAILAAKSPSYGLITATIDGTQTKDCNTSGAAVNSATICSFTGLDPNVTHTLTVKLKTGSTLVLDGFIVR